MALCSMVTWISLVRCSMSNAVIGSPLTSTTTCCALRAQAQQQRARPRGPESQQATAAANESGRYGIAIIP